MPKARGNYLALMVTSFTALCTPALASERPAYKNLRYEENWALQALPDQDYLDPLKYVPLNEKGDVYFSFGGNLRLRGEAWSNFNFDGTADGLFGLSQLRLHSDFHAWDVFRLYLEGISALSTPRSLPGGNRVIDVDALDIQNLFIDLKWPLADRSYVLLRPGRQEMDFGKLRLLSSLPWVNTRRSFDAVRAIAGWDGVRLDAFYAQVVNVSSWGLNTSSPDNSLYGLYASMPVFDTLVSELYWLGHYRAQTSFQGVSGTEARQTIGARVAGKLPWGFDTDLEAAWQFGSFADQGIQAGFVASEIGYQPEALAWLAKPRFVLGLDYASGDGKRGDQQLNTFNQLYPLGHAYYGYADVLGRQNALDLHLGLSLEPLPKLVLALDGHQFWRSSLADDLYGVAGSVLRPGDKGPSAAIGMELDLTLSYKFDAHLSFQGGYSHFFAGGFLAESGPSEGLDFAYLSTNYVF